MIPISLLLVLLGQGPIDVLRPGQSSIAPTHVTVAPADALVLQIQELQDLFDDVNCDQVLLRVRGLRANAASSSLTADQRLRIQFLDAACSVVVGNISDAAARFDELVREDIEVKPPFPLERRVELLLEAARVGEQRRRDEEADRLRRERAESVKLSVNELSAITGGQRIHFVVRVEDPAHVVASARVEFRRKGTRQFYSLPVFHDKGETWRGEIPGTFTRTTEGIQIEWFLVASAEDGAMLQSVGTKQHPRQLDVSPGSEVATDLRASERLPRGTRVLLASFGLPAVTATTFVLSGLIGAVGSVAAKQGRLAPPVQGAVGAILIGLGTAAATLAAYVAVEFLIDDSTPKLAVAAAVAGIGVLATILQAAITVAVAVSGEPKDVLLFSPPILGVAAGVLTVPVGWLAAGAILSEDGQSFE